MGRIIACRSNFSAIGWMNGPEPNEPLRVEHRDAREREAAPVVCVADGGGDVLIVKQAMRLTLDPPAGYRGWGARSGPRLVCQGR